VTGGKGTRGKGQRGKPASGKSGGGKATGEQVTPENATGEHPTGEQSIVVEAPEPPRRVHRPLDLVRLLVALLSLGGALLFGAFTVHTVAGIGQDVTAATGPLPGPLVVLLTIGSGLMLVILPLGLGVDLLYRRQFRTLADGLLALGLTLGTAILAQPFLIRTVSLSVSLVGHEAGSRPLNGFVAGVVALATVTQVGYRTRWRLFTVVTLAVSAAALVSIGYTPLAVVVSLLLGRVVGIALRWAAGATPSRPSPREVIAALRRVGIEITALRPARPDDRDPVVFDATDSAGTPLRLYVLDRDHEGAGVLSSIWRAVRVRQTAGWWTLLSLRRTLDQLALVGLAVAATGVRAQKLVAASPIEPNAAVLAYEDIPGPTFAEADPREITDTMLDAAWAQVRIMHSKAVAHRALDASNLVLTEDGGVGLRVTRSGIIAAGETAVRIDLAQLLVTQALIAGPERSVASALRVIGAATLASVVPVLQPVVLTRGARQALRHHGDLLDEVRENILAAEPSAPMDLVRVERLRPRTVVSAIALTFAAYFLFSRVAGLDLVGVITKADWRWLLAAIAVSVIRFPTAALSIDGFIAERLSLWRTILVQVAASFVSIVAPAGLGGAALNVRYLQRSGVPAAAALASVALWQLGTFVTTVGLLVLLQVVTGSSRTNLLHVPPEAPLALAAAGAIAGLVLAIPAGRRWVFTRLRPYAEQVRPRLSSVFTRPGRLATGIAGTVLQTVATVMVMSLSIDAFGGSVPWALVAVLVLAGTAIGSAAPTPGGIGAVEAVLVAGLTAAAGLNGATALSAVLLFRLLTFWLPVLPGWLAFAMLQRKHLI
jgi:uncharacterized membrane protein YbhN (UPF0104 family)